MITQKCARTDCHHSEELVPLGDAFVCESCFREIRKLARTYETPGVAKSIRRAFRNSHGQPRKSHLYPGKTHLDRGI